MSLRVTHSYYQVAERVSAAVEDISCEDLKKIDRAYGKLFQHHRDSEIWNPFIRRARRVLWDLTEIPLPTDRPRLGVAEAGEELEQLSEGLSQQVDPEDIAQALQVALALKALAMEGLDALGERCRTLLMEGDLQRSRLVVRRAWYREAIEQHFREKGCPVQVIMESQVRNLGVMERLVMVGPIRRYKDYVFNSPRAEKMHTVRYEWASRWDISLKKAGRLFPPPGSERTSRSAGVPGSKAIDYLAPMIDWSGIRRQAEERVGIEQNLTRSHVEVEARLHLLGGGYGVYLSDDRKIYVLDLADEDRVSQVRVRDIGIDSVIILRRERGGRDFIADVADALLGEAALDLRLVQERWKDSLKRKVWELGGIPKTEEVLRRRGSRYQNVRYWIAPENIRTLSRDDFRILMELIGLGQEANSIWSQMGRIDSAHRSAGHQIRGMLLDEVRRADLSRIDHEGYMDFELPIEGAGVLTAFLVERKASEREYVSNKMLRETFPVSPDFWLS